MPVAGILRYDIWLQRLPESFETNTRTESFEGAANQPLIPKLILQEILYIALAFPLLIYPRRHSTLVFARKQRGVWRASRLERVRLNLKRLCGFTQGPVHYMACSNYGCLLFVLTFMSTLTFGKIQYFRGVITCKWPRQRL